MPLALEFATPLLLIGLLAASVPFILHLLASVRAQEAFFPTLRFLRKSMQKTARRRRIQHWLLLLLRAGVLGFLAVAVAEPITRSRGGWSAGDNYAAVIVLDNSYSMAARQEQAEAPTRLAQAIKEATEVLSGDARPAMAALMCTNGAAAFNDLTADVPRLRKSLAAVTVGYGRAPMAQKVAGAIDVLEKDRSHTRRCVYVFSDLQKASFDELSALQASAAAKDVHLFIINCGSDRTVNVGIADVEIGGRRIVEQVLEVTATVVNSSPTDRKVNVSLKVEGQLVGQPIQKTLSAAGADGAIARVRFYYRPGGPGPVQGEVAIDSDDDLKIDNTRLFALDIGGKVGALIVRGAPAEMAVLDPAVHLRLALEPYAQGAAPWSITPRTVEAASFGADDLAGVSSVFLSDVPELKDSQAGALRDFVTRGGTAVLFLGPAVRADNYNKMLADLLPAPLGQAVGEVGSAADAVPAHRIDITHPYFAGLYDNLDDFPAVVAYRYFRLGADARPEKVLMSLRNGAPLICSRTVGQGQVVLCTSTASPRWTNLPVVGMFLPMVARMSLYAPRQTAQDDTYQAQSQVTIRPAIPFAKGTSPSKVPLEVWPPTEDGQEKPVKIDAVDTGQGYAAVFADTWRLGKYRWEISSARSNVGGSFVVNPSGAECDLTPVRPDELVRTLNARGIEHVYVAPTLAEAQALASASAKGHNWWDMVLAIVIVLLVAEAIVANRRRMAAEIVPAPLNPALAHKA